MRVLIATLVALVASSSVVALPCGDSISQTGRFLETRDPQNPVAALKAMQEKIQGIAGEIEQIIFLISAAPR